MSTRIMTPVSIVIAFVIAAGCAESDRFGESSPPTEKEIEATAKRGISVVEDVYRFHHQMGLWPADMAELDHHLKTNHSQSMWGVKNWFDGSWALGYRSPHAHVRYLYVSKVKALWQVVFAEGEVSLDVKQTFPKLPALDDKVVQRNALWLIRNRINQQPKHLIHHKGLVSYLYRKKLYVRAKEECSKTLRRWPDIWWPNCMMAKIHLSLGEFEQGEKLLQKWAKKNNGFAHHFVLAHYYRIAKKDAKCLEALSHACDLQIGGLPVEWEDTGENLGSIGAPVYYAALLAYRLKEYDLSLKVCKRWEKYTRTSGYREPGYLPMRAACYLAIGEFQKAKVNVEKTLKVQGNYGYHNDKDFRALKRAILVNNKAFRYRRKSAEIWEFVVKYE